MKKRTAYTIAAITGLIITTVMLLVFVVLPKAMDRKAFNGGICQRCGGHYESTYVWFDNTSGMDIYEYKCDTCGRELCLNTPQEPIE